MPLNLGELKRCLVFLAQIKSIYDESKGYKEDCYDVLTVIENKKRRNVLLGIGCVLDVRDFH